jgi:hypothetical protein
MTRFLALVAARLSSMTAVVVLIGAVAPGARWSTAVLVAVAAHGVGLVAGGCTRRPRRDALDGYMPGGAL